MIKECTSTGKGKAIDIPGQGDDTSVHGEKRLFNALVSERERVELFVKSKSNEIQGRLSKFNPITNSKKVLTADRQLGKVVEAAKIQQ